MIQEYDTRKPRILECKTYVLALEGDITASLNKDTQLHIPPEGAIEVQFGLRLRIQVS